MKFPWTTKSTIKGCFSRSGQYLKYEKFLPREFETIKTTRDVFQMNVINIKQNKNPIFQEIY